MNHPSSKSKSRSLLTPEIQFAGIRTRYKIPQICVLGFFPTLYSVIRRQYATCAFTLPGSEHSYILFKHRSLSLSFRFPGVGSPAATLCLEQSAALGADTFIVFGSAGGLDSNIHFGDIIIPSYAISDEGTSRHYAIREERSYADPTMHQTISDFFKARNIPTQQGPCWTTDAPYRETLEQIEKYRKLGCAAVEMECSALFAGATFLCKRIGSFFMAVDGFVEDRWVSRLGSNRIQKITPKDLLWFACEIAFSLSMTQSRLD